MKTVITIARLELVAAARLKWIRLLTTAFALLAASAAYSAGSASELSGADGFARTTMTLIPVSLLLIPLAAIVLGVSSQSAEGGESFLFGQPVARIAVLAGRWLGSAAALCGTIGLGFGAAAVIVLTSAGRDGAVGYALFVAASMALAAIFLSIGAAIAVTTDKRTTALGAGVFAWFFFVLLYDGIALSVAGWLTGRIGGRVLFGSILANPADLARVAMLRLAGTADVLGASGEAWIRFLGGDATATIVTLLMLAVWTAAPLTFAAATLNRRDR
jgi:Cu-processing system permease protein